MIVHEIHDDTQTQREGDTRHHVYRVRACTCLCLGDRWKLIDGAVVLIDASAHSYSFTRKCTVTLSFLLKHMNTFSHSARQSVEHIRYDLH